MRYLTSQSAVSLMAAVLSGCASQYCDLAPEQTATLARTLETVISDHSDAEVSYQVGFDGTFRPIKSDDPNVCLVLLEPRALREGHSVLDGELAVYFDRTTLQVARVADIVY